MSIKTGILAAAAVLTLAVPAAALAQPGYGYAPTYGQNNGYSQNYGYGQTNGYDRGDLRRDDWRRIAREREMRREMELRRLRWEREHAFRDGGFRDDFRR